MTTRPADRVRSAYGANCDRLVAVKAKYDPDNFFRGNQNVAAPAGSRCPWIASCLDPAREASSFSAKASTSYQAHGSADPDVGGGLGGLALARALQQRGLAADVAERAAQWEPVGTGLCLPANGVRVLRRLGLDQALRSRGRVIPRQRVLDHRGRLLLDIGLDEIWGETGECLAVHRNDLHEVLREGTAIRLGTTVEAVREEADAVRVRLSDGLHRRL